MLRILVGKYRIWLSLVCLISLLGLLVGCGSVSQSSAPGQKPYVIHTLLSETGTAAFLGQEHAKAFEVLQKEVNASGGINGTPVQFDIADNGTNPATAVSLASKILSGNPQVLINGSVVPTDLPVDKLATANGPVIYDMSPGVHPAPHSFIYSQGQSTRLMMQAVLNFLKAKGWTRVVAITSTDASGQDGWNQLQNDVKLPQNQGIEVVDHETFGVEDVSVSAQLTRIATFKPQAIIAWSTGSPIATVFKGLMQSGLQKVPVLTTNGNETYTQMHSYASFLPQQLYFPSPQFAAVDDLAPGPAKTTVQAFFSAFTKQGIKADIPYAQAWDVGNILINALKHVGLQASPDQIRQYIDNNMEGYVGVLGTYHFSPTDHRGLDVSGIWITRWDQSKDNWVPVSGAGGLGTP